MSDNNDAENTLHYEYLQETLILRDCNPHYLKYRNFTQFLVRKLCLSKKFLHQEIRWNYCILRCVSMWLWENPFLRRQTKSEKVTLAVDVFCKLQIYKWWIVACFLPSNHLFKAYPKFSEKLIFLTQRVRDVSILEMLRTH